MATEGGAHTEPAEAGARTETHTETAEAGARTETHTETGGATPRTEAHALAGGAGARNERNTETAGAGPAAAARAGDGAGDEGTGPAEGGREGGPDLSGGAGERVAGWPSVRRAPVPVVVAAVLAVVVLLAVAAWAAGGDDDGDPGDGGSSASSTTTAGTEGVPGEAPATTATTAPSSTTTTTAAGEIPAGWTRYEDPNGAYTIAHPEGWRVEPGNPRTRIRDPETGSYLMIDWTDEPRPDPVADWRAQSQGFADGHEAYQEIQIAPYRYRDYNAAVWEFRYRDQGVDLHVANLGFVAGNRGYALYFQTHQDRWAASQDTFTRFRDTFRPG